jgi:Ca2+-transporting ATPase
MRVEVPIDRLQGLDSRGLTAAEVAERRAHFGPNDVIEVPQGQALELALETARDPMLWFLVGTSVVYAALGDWTEASVLLASILPLAGMDLFLHRRTQASTQGLRGRLATHARVERDGVELEIASGDVVVGDLALVRAGDAFPADGVLLAVDGCQVDESALTGEAFPVRKSVREIAMQGSAELELEGEHWGLAGTRVLTGSARMRVAWVGGETMYGGIVRSATTGKRSRTPLQVSIANLVRGLLVAALVLCATLALVRWRQGHGIVDALVSAMTLAIAALPEEFPVVFTVFLGVGVYRLANRGALVRRAVTVENIGRVTTICSDKTGTITEGKLRLALVVPASGRTESDVLIAAACASQGAVGDPLDEALLAAARGLALPRVVERFPFTEDRRRETAIVATDAGRVVATKGSPETVLALCEGEDGDAVRARVLALATQGRKVIACATQSMDSRVWSGGEPDRGFRLAGLIAFEDPVRPSVREAIAECRDAGIRTIVVTGDHPATARAIAGEIGLGDGDAQVVLGDELEALWRDDPRRMLGVHAVARAIPSQKLALVRALQNAGEIVAVTGDGVNDVPALQAADIGIAMGERGTRSARETASIVLLDDDFGTIVRAIAEGRQLFRNLQSGFEYLLVIHVPLVMTAAVIPLAGYPLLYLPIHIVWMELMIHPTAMLVFQEMPPRVRLARTPRRASGAFFSRSKWVTIALVGSLLTIGIVAAYDRSLGAGRDVEHARAMVLVAMTFASVGVTAVLTGMRTRVARIVAGASLAVALLVVQVPILAQRLHLSPLHVDDWGVGAGVAALCCVPLAVLHDRERRRRRPSVAKG